MYGMSWICQQHMCTAIVSHRYGHVSPLGLRPLSPPPPLDSHTLWQFIQVSSGFVH